MKVIALQGNGNRGKSTVLAALYAELCARKGVNADTSDAPAPSDVLADIDGERKARRQGSEYEVKDFSAVLSVQGRRIGIWTAGDSESEVLSALDYFASGNCELGFCAVRSKGKAVHALEAFGRKKSNRVVFVPKAVIEDAEGYSALDGTIDSLNDWQVEKLLEYI